MHKRKGVLANSPALFSLKLCIYFRLFPPFSILFLPFFVFFRLFLSFLSFSCPLISFFCLFYIFCPFYPFYILFRFFNSSLPFVILLYPFIPSFLLFLPFRLLYSALFRFIFSNHLFLFLISSISYPLYVLCISFCTSLYFTFYLFFALIPFIFALFTGFIMY